jgi:broad specificity phosphatase PhoE
MSKLRRVVMIRHGETDGESSVRFHGSGDVDLSEEGRAQMRVARARLQGEVLDAVVASPLRRSWRSAWILGRGLPVRLEPDFREIHFGRWEGLTAEEIEAKDPARYQAWQSGEEGFEFPGGEPRAEFRARVERGLERLIDSGARGALLVVHKGVIRTLVEKLTGDSVERGQPALGEIVGVSRAADGTWFPGRHSSNPPGLDEPSL